MILDKNFSNQSLLFLISIALERMGFYGIRVLLVIYMISPTFGMTNKETMTIYSWFVSLIIIAKIIGALIGDFVIGNKNSIVVGGILQAVGAFLVSVPSIYTFYSGLFLIILGGGLYSPNLIANFGKLHLYQSKLLDAQFTLLYLFINIGSFIGTLAVGFLAEKYNFSVGFIIAGVLFLLSILTVRNTKKEKNILLEYKFVPKNKKLIYVIFVFLLIAFFWVFHNISLIKFYDIDLMFKRSLSSNIPKNILSQFELIYFIPISFILYYLWSKFYYNRLYKIASAFIFAAISFSIILILEDDLIQSNVTLYLLSLFFLYLSEAHIAPVIHSTLTQHLNSKYLASFISVSFIPTALMTMLVYSFHEKIYENNILPLYVGIIGMSISAIIILAIMYMRKTKVNKSFH